MRKINKVTGVCLKGCVSDSGSWLAIGQETRARFSNVNKNINTENEWKISEIDKIQSEIT